MIDGLKSTILKLISITIFIEDVVVHLSGDDHFLVFRESLSKFLQRFIERQLENVFLACGD